MRREKELSDFVNVHTHSERAAARVGSNGRLQDAALLPTSDTVTLWERVRRLFPSPEALTVGARQVTGFIVPHWAAGVILAAILSVGFATYTVFSNKLSDQRDMLIRLDTQLQERDKHEMEFRQEVKTKTNVQQLQIDQITRQYDVVKSLLTVDQRRSVEQSTRKEN